MPQGERVRWLAVSVLALRQWFLTVTDQVLSSRQSSQICDSEFIHQFRCAHGWNFGEAQEGRTVQIPGTTASGV